jgi:hypothetical protein
MQAHRSEIGMINKLVKTAVFAMLACIGIASSVLRAQSEGDPITRDCRGEATYTTNSTGVPFNVSFDFAMRDGGGEDLGWAMARTSGAEGVGFDPGYNASARIDTVEFHADVAIFVSVWERGTSGALGTILGLGTNEIRGVATIVGLRDGVGSGQPDQVSEAFFWPPDQVPANPSELLEAEALDDFGQQFPGFEGATVREYILAQLMNSNGYVIHPGGDIQISGGR